MYRLLSLSLAILLLLSLPITGKAAEADSIQALNKAEDYLSSQIVDPVVGSVGGEWSVIAMAREGRLTEEARTEYLKNLQYVLEQKKGILHPTKYTEYSRTVLALTAIGTDPRNVKEYDVLAPLADFTKVTKQGINGAVYALIALDSGNYKVPKLPSSAKNKVQTTRENLVDYILEAELSDGGWGLLDKPDDITPMAIQSLLPYQNKKEVKAAIQRALTKLSTMQEADGGFSKDSGSETISQTIIALSAYDVSLLTSDQFVKNGKTLLDALLTYQNKNGSFSHILGRGEDMMATEQATLALCAYKRAMNKKNSLYDMTDVKARPDIPELEYIPGQQGNSESVVIPGLNGELAVQGTKPQNDGTSTPSAGTSGTSKPGAGDAHGTTGTSGSSDSKKESTKKKVVTRKKVKKKKSKTNVKDKEKTKKSVKKKEKKTDQVKKKNSKKKGTDQVINKPKDTRSYTPIIWGSVIGVIVVACVITKIVLEVKRKKRRMKWRSNSKR